MLIKGTNGLVPNNAYKYKFYCRLLSDLSDGSAFLDWEAKVGAQERGNFNSVGKQKKNIDKQSTKARSFRADTWHVKAFYEIGMRVHL